MLVFYSGTNVQTYTRSESRYWTRKRQCAFHFFPSNICSHHPGITFRTFILSLVNVAFFFTKMATFNVISFLFQGCKIKMDDSGNILVKRIAKSNVYVKTTSPDDNAVSAEILKLPNNALEPEKPVKLFDMKKFQQNVSREMKRSYPDRWAELL